MNSQLKIRMKGEFPKGGLSVFRDQVGLTPRGRLDDDWDEEFGRRELRPKELGRVDLTLWRYADDDWMISLSYERDPLPAEETEDLRRTILDAVAHAGLTVTAQVLS
ncbi:hypothetical protein ABZX75_00625 [Streptomyces sp. NPDC003038]|uniref:hypothetical protein n=1 Tax=unclassified Streptomyces TaxID=2593676 RepID=UPI0033BF2F9F